MTNKYLEKIASDHLVRGVISPAWQQAAIAKDHGHNSAGDWGQAWEKETGGRSRQALRSGVETEIGGTAGYAAGALAGKLLSKKLAMPTGLLGAAIGGAHGLYASTKNQAAEAHKKYS